MTTSPKQGEIWLVKLGSHVALYTVLVKDVKFGNGGVGLVLLESFDMFQDIRWHKMKDVEFLMCLEKDEYGGLYEEV